MSCPSPLPVQGSPREGCIIIKKPLALFREIYYYMICAWGYSSVGERSVRIRKAVSSNLIISISSLPYGGLFYGCVCSSVDRALDSGSRCAGSTPVRRIEKRLPHFWQSFFCLRIKVPAPTPLQPILKNRPTDVHSEPAGADRREPQVRSEESQLILLPVIVIDPVREHFVLRNALLIDLGDHSLKLEP